MKITYPAANQTEIEIGSDTVFFSYSTPVAAFISGRGVVITNENWSKTTTKHINQFIDRNCPTATKHGEPQEFFDNLLEIQIKK